MNNQVKLFAFPFAGGSSMSFYKWRKHLNASVQWFPVELAGRGTRQKAPLCQSFEEIVEDAYGQIRDQVRDGPFAFFGHSMGSLIAYEVACLIRERRQLEPKLMFLSGRWAPHVTRHNLVDSSTPDELLKERLLDLGGATDELFDNKQLADLFIPILRSDFRLMEGYACKPNIPPLSAAIHVLTGTKDTDVNQRDLTEWSKYTTGEFAIHKFAGGHFFINDSFESVLQHVNRAIDGLYVQGGQF